MGGLQLRILNDNGEAAPARISILGADGRYYAPDGVMIHADDYYDRALAPAETTYFHTDGEADLAVPVGEATEALRVALEIEKIGVGSIRRMMEVEPG